ncbi:hypothetical protein DACRYDRAFT_119114 [Dacryopinax primogenitus]|uniref:P-loop containing nucleoside triphosphate hydrolase protein n=1 Tax=Dacryopinax primogenitus (strain DJM 731) TaxID=1858805 RepID=M5FQS6_DACPD|nr:uncharacterized protein DACRYDRAFT_119114 [Dacryopinax primogenitus]EJT97923.1 hypothetical protein DACRYDRAFT_119114 [Dacryopinax primogenitus]
MGDMQAVSGQRNADISNSLYALHARQLFDVIDQIRDSGGEHHLDLPRIVVIGNQSAGKSSLIEAIAGIKVPRGSGTCTRCPMEVRLHRKNEPWRCSIRLRYEYDEYGEKRDDPLNINFGNDIVDPAKVDIMLRRAQLAILNDEDNPGKFVDIDPNNMAVSDSQRQFSRNVVCIEVFGPDLTDLTFVDLPGIIQHHPTDPGLVNVIKGMVKAYIAGSSALILCTITMKDDPENQAALSEAKTADPHGARTIGVLTKPDTLQPQEEGLWITVLKNEGSHRLNLGYYITKQPAQAEVEQGISFDMARQNEVSFFETTEAWRALPSSIRQTNVSTPRLTAALSTLLSSHIRKSLRDITEKVHRLLSETQRDLRSLGTGPSNNPVADIIALCDRFTGILRAYIVGTEDSELLIQDNKRAFSRFKTSIRGTAPVFIPYTTVERKWNEYTEPTHILEDVATEDNGHTYDLDMVRKHINNAKTRELPFNVPYAAKVQMMLLPIKRWQTLIDVCFEAIVPNVRSLIEKTIKQVFGEYAETGLLGRVKDIVSNQLIERENATQIALKLLFDMEVPGPYTQNHHYFSATREKLVTHYRQKRKERESAPTRPTSAWGLAPSEYASGPTTSRSTIINQVISGLATLGFQGVTESDFGKLVIEDEWEEEITVMAETRAYLQVAYKRIIDSVPQAIDLVFIRPLADTLHTALIAGLQFDSPSAHELCRAYLAENPAKAAERVRLLADKERLERVKETLMRIGLGH